MSKKVIRLTESELKRYINKVVSEQVAPAPTGGGPNFQQSTPKVPVTGGTPELMQLKGKAVLLSSDEGQGSWSCVISSAAQFPDNTIYINVTCENDPKAQWIRYKAIEQGPLILGFSGGAKSFEVVCPQLLEWLKKTVKPFVKKHDFVKNGGSNNGHDFA